MRGNKTTLREVFDLPDGAIHIGAVGVCQYLDDDGEMKFGYVYDTTDLPLSSTLGLLDLAGRHIYDQAMEDD